MNWLITIDKYEYADSMLRTTIMKYSTLIK